MRAGLPKPIWTAIEDVGLLLRSNTQQGWIPRIMDFVKDPSSSQITETKMSTLFAYNAHAKGNLYTEGIPFTIEVKESDL